MQQRKSSSAFGRPSGTDGSDFSYRMVVDSRYTKVAKGKSRLSSLFFIQGVIQLIGVPYTFLSTWTEEGLNKFAISFVAVGFISLILGELGRRYSRVSLLKLFMIASSIAILLSTARVATSDYTFQLIHDPSMWESKKLEILEIARVLLGLLLQIFTTSTILSLIGNMSPPKRAS